MTDYLSEELRSSVRRQAGNRCGYCLSPQHLVMGLLEIEHILPRAAGGSDDESNLWLACRLCNSFKSSQTQAVDPHSGKVVELFHPRTQVWGDHFQWSRDGTHILGKTPCGRATVMALQLNNLVATTVRRFWVQAGWHPPETTAVADAS